MILDVAPLELVILGGVALLVIPPKDLPRAMRFAGQWVGRARGLARQFRSGFDDMIREAEFAEMEKKWKAENERIMREFPQSSDLATLPAPGPDPVSDADDAPPVMVARPAVLPEPDTLPEAAPETPTTPAKPRARAKAATAPGTASPSKAGAATGRIRTTKAAPSSVPGE